MAGNSIKIRCPSCGAEPPIDDLCLDVLEEGFRERNEEGTREAVSFQQSESARRAREAAGRSRVEQEAEESQLLERIAPYEEAGRKSSEDLRKSEEGAFRLQQVLQSAEAEAQKRAGGQMADVQVKARRKSDEAAQVPVLRRLAEAREYEVVHEYYRGLQSDPCRKPPFVFWAVVAFLMDRDTAGFMTIADDR